MNERLDDETQYKLLNTIQAYPNASQRQLAKAMGVSLGKVNYCIKALLDVGHVKLNNFARSKNKLGYVYVLTPKGFKEKASVTLRFLELKQAQYGQLKKEIAALKKETKANDKTSEI
jgi:EPS-associated MarR family transcriptional regulator